MSVLTVINWMVTANNIVTSVMLLTFSWGVLFKLIRG